MPAQRVRGLLCHEGQEAEEKAYVAAHGPDIGQGGRVTQKGPTLFDYVPPAPTTELPDTLARMMLELAEKKGDYGITIGEVVYKYEHETGRLVGGKPMEDKVREQRQSSWLPHVPRKAGLVATDRVRPSPLKRHHGKPQRVYVLRKFAEAAA